MTTLDFDRLNDRVEQTKGEIYYFEVYFTLGGWERYSDFDDQTTKSSRRDETNLRMFLSRLTHPWPLSESLLMVCQNYKDAIQIIKSKYLRGVKRQMETN